MSPRALSPEVQVTRASFKFQNCTPVYDYAWRLNHPTSHQSCKEGIGVSLSVSTGGSLGEEPMNGLSQRVLGGLSTLLWSLEALPCSCPAQPVAGRRRNCSRNRACDRQLGSSQGCRQAPGRESGGSSFTPATAAGSPNPA